MGLGTSRMGPAPSHGARRLQCRRPAVKRSFSAFLICGASSSREMEDYPAELLVNPPEFGDGVKYKRKGSDLSLGSRAALVDIKTEHQVSSGRFLTANESLDPETCPSIAGPGDEGKRLSKSRELVPCQSMVNSKFDDTASTSCMDRPSPDCVYAAEITNVDAVEDTNSSINGDSSHIVEALSNSNCLPSHGPEESLLNEVSTENSISEAIDFSDSEYGSSSVVSGSPIGFHLMRYDSLGEVIPSAVGFLVSEREQNRQMGNLIHGDLMSISSNTLSSNSADTSSRDARRYSRRLLWDVFSRRSPGIDSVSRSLHFSTDESDHFRSQDRLLLDFSGDFLSDELRGDIRSRESRTQGSNEQQWNSRSEIWERVHDSLDSTDPRSVVCPRRIHADGLCSCRSGLSTEESGSRTVSRMVFLAQALFEVLDHIHRHPMSLSLSTASLPAPESVIDSFPVKIHRREKILESAEDVSQCYICLADYEEGDQIRVLPCRHEYHMSCVDKWLKEIHGVCPLCRGDVTQGSTEASVSNQENHSH